MKQQVKTIFIQMIGAIAAVCCPVYGYYPVAMAFFSAAYSVYGNIGASRLMFPVILCALWAHAGMESAVKYGVCMFAALIIYEMIRRKKGVLKNITAALFMGGILWVVEAAGGFMTGDAALYALLGGFEAAVVMGLSGMFHMALSSKVIMESRNAVFPNSAEMVALGMFAAMIIYALYNIVEPIMVLPVFFAANYLLILIYAYRYGAGMGGIAGAACGVVMLAVDGNTAYLGIFCLLGIAVGFFNHIGKFASVAAYFACLWILALLYFPFILETSQLIGFISAAVIFIILPAKFTFCYKQTSVMTETEKIKDGSDKIVETAAVFRQLADSVKRINREDDVVFATELQLELAAGTLEKISESMLSEDLKEGKSEQERAVKKAFAQKGYEVKRMNIKTGNRGETIVHMTMCTEKGRVETSKEAAGIISDVFEKTFCPAPGCKTIVSREFAGYTFMEEPAFKMLYGSASVTKNGEEMSGDNFTFAELGTGEVLLGIVDGMGSGSVAGEDSEIVIELLEELLRAGFEEEAALSLINSVLITREKEQSLTAIDMAVGDLYTGRFNFVKLGAAATFIKRNRWVDVIQSTNYPIGILKKVDYENTVKKLYDGDYIVMVSDGILDAVVKGEKEELLSEWISEYSGKNPKEFAQYILDMAMKEADGRANDDMTVLVAGIWNV